MKHTPSLRLLLAAAAVGFANFASATTLAWDTVSGDSAITGGVGTWDTVATKWSSDAGLTDIAWVNANNDTAVFGGTGGLVSLAAGGITAGGLTFNAGGYTIGSNTLTLAGAAIVSVTDSGDTATISSVITGAAGLTKEGSGTLVLSGANNHTGGTTVNNGLLVLFGPSGTSAATGRITGTLIIGAAGQVNLGGVNWALGYDTTTSYVDTITINGGILNQAAAGGTSAHTVNMTGGTIQGGSIDYYNLASAADIAFNTYASASTATVSAGMNLRMKNGATTGGTMTFTVEDGDAATDLLINGNITVGGTASTQRIVKTGAGVMKLTGTNTYGGGTTITGGTLEAGSLTALGTGAVKISGGTLGTSVAAVNIGALTLDNAASTLTINGTNTGTVTLAAGAALTMTSGKIAIDITGASTFDKIVGTGTGHFTLTGGTLELAGFSGFEGTGGTGNTYNLLAGFAGTGNSTTGLSITGYDTTNWLASLDASTGVLSFAAVPEPSTYGLIGAGALAAVAFVRRRRRHAGAVAA